MHTNMHLRHNKNTIKHFLKGFAFFKIYYMASKIFNLLSVDVEETNFAYKSNAAQYVKGLIHVFGA